MPAPPTDCGSLGALSDELGSEVSDWDWAMEGTWALDGSAVRLTPAAGELAAMYSRTWWWLDRGELTVRFDLSAMQDDALLELVLTGADGEIRLVRDGNVIRADVHQADFNGTRGTVAFDRRLDWWRLARVGERWHWSTSTDGVTWTERGDFDAALSGLGTLAVLHTGGADPGDVGVEALNPGGPAEPPCPLAGFRDDFSAPSPRWGVLDEAACDVRFGDGAAIALSGGAFCGLLSAERFSLEDSEVTVELTDAGDCSLSPALQVAFAGGELSLVCTPGPEVLRAFLDTGSGVEELASAAWDPARHRHLRLLHLPGEENIVVFETSPDGVEWNGLASATGLAGFDLTSVEVSLTVYSPTEAPPGARVVFDRLNIPPDAE